VIDWFDLTTYLHDERRLFVHCLIQAKGDLTLSSLLQLQKQTGNKEIGLIGSRCELLVHTSEQVSEYSAQARVGNNSQAHLVGDTNDRLLPGARERQKVASYTANKLLTLMLVFVTHEPIGNKQCQAIYDYDASLTRLSECFINITRLFNRAPVGWPFRSVARNSLCHVFV
jgi:hypothetical protein